MVLMFLVFWFFQIWQKLYIHRNYSRTNYEKDFSIYNLHALYGLFIVSACFCYGHRNLY